MLIDGTLVIFQAVAHHDLGAIKQPLTYLQSAHLEAAMGSTLCKSPAQ
jgi:hypothetical protein